MRHLFIVCALVAASTLAVAANSPVEHGQLLLTGSGEARVVLDVTLPADDVLTGVSSPAATAGMVHSVRRRGAGEAMVPTTLALRAGVTRHLSVHGDHLMLTGLKPVRSGDPVSLVLTFAHHVPVRTVVLVR